MPPPPPLQSQRPVLIEHPTAGSGTPRRALGTVSSGLTAPVSHCCQVEVATAKPPRQLPSQRHTHAHLDSSLN